VVGLEGRPDGDLGNLLEENVLESTLCLPHRAGDIEPRERRALLTWNAPPSERVDGDEEGWRLTLVLVGTTNGTNGSGTDVGARVHELPVLASRLSDDTGVREVLAHVVGNRLPERLEDVGRSSKVETGKEPVVNDLDPPSSARSAGRREEGRTLETSLMVSSPLGQGRNWMTFLGSPASWRIWRTTHDE
jgi:hypothetical protein